MPSFPRIDEEALDIAWQMHQDAKEREKLGLRLIHPNHVKVARELLRLAKRML